jgi:hypothetical protein
MIVRRRQGVKRLGLMTTTRGRDPVASLLLRAMISARRCRGSEMGGVRRAAVESPCESVRLEIKHF